MKINIKYIKERDLFEMQVVEPQLRAHFLLKRDLLNHLRGAIERALCESRAKKTE